MHNRIFSTGAIFVNFFTNAFYANSTNEDIISKISLQFSFLHEDCEKKLISYFKIHSVIFI